MSKADVVLFLLLSANSMTKSKTTNVPVNTPANLKSLEHLLVPAERDNFNILSIKPASVC